MTSQKHIRKERYKVKQVINIDNIKFVSLNKRYRGRYHLSDEYKAFRDEIMLSIKKGHIDSPYAMLIQIHTYLDYDNVLKLIGDCLEKTGVIDNDRNFHHVTIDKYPIQRGKLGKLIVWVGTL
jgi:Holliday junction resolvase RusA-like endonuclease